MHRSDMEYSCSLRLQFVVPRRLLDFFFGHSVPHVHAARGVSPAFQSSSHANWATASRQSAPPRFVCRIRDPRRIISCLNAVPVTFDPHMPLAGGELRFGLGFGMLHKTVAV